MVDLQRLNLPQRSVSDVQLLWWFITPSEWQVDHCFVLPQFSDFLAQVHSSGTKCSAYFTLTVKGVSCFLFQWGCLSILTNDADIGLLITFHFSFTNEELPQTIKHYNFFFQIKKRRKPLPQSQRSLKIHYILW